MPDFGKDITKQQASYFGNQGSPIGRLFGNLLQRYMYQADQSGAMSDLLLGGEGFGRANPNANPFYGGMYTSEGEPYGPAGSEGNPSAPGGAGPAYETGGVAGPGMAYAKNRYEGGGEPSGGGGGGLPGDPNRPGYNLSSWQYGGAPKGGLIGELGQDTATDEDLYWAEQARKFGSDPENQTLLNKWGGAGDTGFYGRADESASQNWKQLFENQGEGEKVMWDTIAHYANDPGKYEGDVADMFRKLGGPGEYEGQIGRGFGSLIDRPGFSDAEKTALEQQGMATARAATDALRAEAENRAAATGNEGSAMAALASLGRSQGRTLGEQARQNILAEAAQRRSDIQQGGTGLQTLQSSINAREAAAGQGMQGLQSSINENRGRMAGYGVNLAEMENARKQAAATAASQRAENLAARKFKGLEGETAQAATIMGQRQAGMQAGMGQAAELAARRAQRLAQKQALQNQLAQQQFGSTGAMGQIATIPTEQYGVTSSAGGGI